MAPSQQFYEALLKRGRLYGILEDKQETNIRSTGEEEQEDRPH